MPKYYIAEVTLVTKYEVRVSASDENDPEKEAIKKVERKVKDRKDMHEISSQIGDVKLKFDGETKFKVGSKIRHHVFGVGVIKDLIRTTNGYNEKGEMATIEFEDKGVKKIQLSMIEQKVEIVEEA